MQAVRKKEKGWRKYLFWFFHRIDKEIWEILPFKAKVGLIFLDVILYSIIAILLINLMRIYFFGGTGIHIYWN